MCVPWRSTGETQGLSDSDMPPSRAGRSLPQAPASTARVLVPRTLVSRPGTWETQKQVRRCLSPFSILRPGSIAGLATDALVSKLGKRRGLTGALLLKSAACGSPSLFVFARIVSTSRSQSQAVVRSVLEIRSWRLGIDHHQATWG